MISSNFLSVIRHSSFETTGSAWAINVQRTCQSLLLSDNGIIEVAWRHSLFLCSPDQKFVH